MTTAARTFDERLQTFRRRFLSDKERFDDGYAVDSNGCWVWNKSTRGTKPYGQFWMRGKNMKANRASWILYKGSIPHGMCVLHNCDNPSCVNPEHLFLGTNQDNSDDMYQKGRDRHLSCESHPLSKLTKQQVLEILNSNEKQKDLAMKFKVCKMQISRIKRGLRWKGVNAKS